MGAQLRYGTAGATGGGWSSQPGTLQPALVERGHEPRWQWQARGPKTWKDRNAWMSMWSFGCRVGFGSPLGSDGCGWHDLTMPDLFEPFSCDGEGTSISFPTQYAGLRFFKGTVQELCLVALADAPAGAQWRIDKNGTQYAVYLVDTTDPDASHIRIETPAGVKAARLKT